MTGDELDEADNTAGQNSDLVGGRQPLNLQLGGGDVLEGGLQAYQQLFALLHSPATSQIGLREMARQGGKKPANIK
jgi:hypothetical protein